MKIFFCFHKAIYYALLAPYLCALSPPRKLLIYLLQTKLLELSPRWVCLDVLSRKEVLATRPEPGTVASRYVLAVPCSHMWSGGI
eukprot:COSAG06_NODE_583_length_14006_cov_10.629251_11_plen_85_part_00